jgi:hypothetical protein
VNTARTDDKNLIRESPAQSVMVDYLCIHCKSPMRATRFQCYLDGIQHVCTKCGRVEVLDRRYPYVKHHTS